jgi:hypothetical protein
MIFSDCLLDPIISKVPQSTLILPRKYKSLEHTHKYSTLNAIDNCNQPLIQGIAFIMENKICRSTKWMTN